MLLGIEGIQPDLVVVQLGSDLPRRMTTFVSFEMTIQPYKRQVSTHSLFESFSFLKGQRIRLGDDRNDVGDLGQLSQDGNIDLRNQHASTHQYRISCQASR